MVLNQGFYSCSRFHTNMVLIIVYFTNDSPSNSTGGQPQPSGSVWVMKVCPLLPPSRMSPERVLDHVPIQGKPWCPWPGPHPSPTSPTLLARERRWGLGCPLPMALPRDQVSTLVRSVSRCKLSPDHCSDTPARAAGLQAAIIGSQGRGGYRPVPRTR